MPFCNIPFLSWGADDAPFNVMRNYKDITGDTAAAYVDRIRREQAKQAEISSLLDEVIELYRKRGYSVHGSLTAIDQKGRTYFRRF